MEDKIIYMCMCDDMEKRRIPFGFLEDIKEKMLTGYGQKMKTAHAYSLNEEFGGTLQARMDFYNGPDADNFSQVRMNCVFLEIFIVHLYLFCYICC